MGCRYCDKKHPLSNLDNVFTVYINDDKKLCVEDSEGDIYYAENTQIHYCPMCGKKLEKPNDIDKYLTGI